MNSIDKLSDGVHVLKIETTKQITDVAYKENATTVSAEDSGKLYAYHCKEGDCIRTYGYFKMGTGDGYYRLKSGVASTKVADGQTTCTGKAYGDLDTTGGNFCLGEDEGVPIVTDTSTTYTMIPNKQGNIFTAVAADSGHILLKSTKYALILDNFEGKLYLISLMLKKKKKNSLICYIFLYFKCNIYYFYFLIFVIQFVLLEFNMLI